MIIFDDTYTLDDFGLKLIYDHTHPISPTIELKALKIPGKNGLYYFDSETNERNFTLTFDIAENDIVLMQYKFNSFVKFLHEDNGKPRFVKMMFLYEPDKYYTVILNNSIEPTRAYALDQFELNLTAYDPYKYGLVYSDEVTWGSEAITFESSYLMGHTGSAGETNLTSSSTLYFYVDGLNIKPIITITGSATGLVLSNGTYSITFPNFTNATWVIDCEKYTVLKNNENAFGELSIRDFVLLQGNNEVLVIATTLNMTVSIKYRDKYL